MRLLKIVKKGMLGLVLFSASQFLLGSFVIVQRAANPYQLKSEDVWNLNIVSTETQSVNVKIFGSITKDGQKIIDLESRNVAIQPGANALSAFNVATQRKNYLNKNILEIEKLTLMLPAGNYELCIYLRCANPSCDGLNYSPFDVEASYCQQVKVEPPTPLQLTYPTDQEKIKQTKPTLSWIPPGPIASSSKLTFMITLVEMNEGQTKQDAIKRNRPLLRKTGHSLTSLMYPLDLADLEVGHKYAWQVEAWVGDQWISTSEVWEFEVEEELKDEEIPKEQSYINIASQTGAAKYYAKGILKINYESQFKIGLLKFEIRDKNDESVQVDSLVFRNGENYYEIKLPSNTYRHKQKYKIVLANSANTKYTISFFFIDPDKIK